MAPLANARPTPTPAVLWRPARELIPSASHLVALTFSLSTGSFSSSYSIFWKLLPLQPPTLILFQRLPYFSLRSFLSLNPHPYLPFTAPQTTVNPCSLHIQAKECLLAEVISHFPLTNFNGPTLKKKKKSQPYLTHLIGSIPTYPKSPKWKTCLSKVLVCYFTSSFSHT